MSPRRVPWSCWTPPPGPVGCEGFRRRSERARRSWGLSSPSPPSSGRIRSPRRGPASTVAARSSPSSPYRGAGSARVPSVPTASGITGWLRPTIAAPPAPVAPPPPRPFRRRGGSPRSTRSRAPLRRGASRRPRPRVDHLIAGRPGSSGKPERHAEGRTVVGFFEAERHVQPRASLERRAGGAGI